MRLNLVFFVAINQTVAASFFSAVAVAASCVSVATFVVLLNNLHDFSLFRTPKSEGNNRCCVFSVFHSSYISFTDRILSLWHFRFQTISNVPIDENMFGKKKHAHAPER